MDDITNLIKIHQELGGLDSQVIHIAGSKGKGTTAMILAKILEMSGKKVGVFSSPAIFRIEEMVQINGQPIDEETMKRRMETVPALREDLSEFEAITLASLLHFQKERCDYVILEAGWGGKNDATNVVGNKILTLLTHIELEHTEVLGQSIAEIAQQKLGICRPGAPLLTVASQVAEVFAEIEGMDLEPILAPIVELGHHHPESVGLALTAADHLGINITERIQQGIATMQIPGRFEIIELGHHTLILDGAHTLDSVTYIREKVLDFAQEEGLAEPFWCIHFLSDKNKEIWKLFPPNRTIWTTFTHPRAGEAPNTLPQASVEEVFEQLKFEETPKLVVFVGSFRLVAEVKRNLSQ